MARVTDAPGTVLREQWAAPDLCGTATVTHLEQQLTPDARHPTDPAGPPAVGRRR